MDRGSNPHDSECYYFFLFLFFLARIDFLDGNRYRKLQFDIFTARVQMGKLKVCLFHKSRFSPEGIEIVKIEPTKNVLMISATLTKSGPNPDVKMTSSRLLYVAWVLFLARYERCHLIRIYRTVRYWKVLLCDVSINAAHIVKKRS